VAGGPEAPLILTLRMDAASFGRFDALRRAHFPPERNLIPAHLTLFHHLPGDRAAEVAAALAAACAEEAPIDLAATGLRPLGRGVAFELDAPRLLALRRRLAALWAPWLTAQDRAGFRPHVTVQNKVAPIEARALLGRLRAGFEPFPVRGEGLLLWRYLGGPWAAAGDFPFRGAHAP
jgi:2'-5' RNA ligase